jgi:hypothetical protein
LPFAAGYRRAREFTAANARNLRRDVNGAVTLVHDPEKHVLDPDRGWGPVSRLREARFGGRRKVGKDHAQEKC